MNTEDQQELISAYLDGELTADEQRAAETLLAESEEARELLEELRGLQSRVRELPKFSLGADFSQAVLDQAERAMISGAGVAAATGTDVDDRDGEADETNDDHDLRVFYAERDKADRAAVVKRRIVWSVLAVAAALLIMVVLPQHEQQDVAQLEPQAGSSDANTASGSAKKDKTSAGEAGTDEGGRNLSISAANETPDAGNNNLGVAATEQKSVLERSPQQGFTQPQPKAAESVTQDGASADSARQPVAGAIVDHVASPKDRAAVASGGAGPALEVAPEANVELQMAADYDGIAVFEIDERSVASIDGLKSVDDASAPADNAWQFFRPVPLDKLADLRDAPFADEAEVDDAKSKSDAEQQVYAYVAEGTSEEIRLALAVLEKQATNYQAVEMKPQLAASLAEFGGRGRSLGRAELKADDDAKKQLAQSRAFGGVTDAEAPVADAPVADAFEAVPSKPAPALAPAEKPAAPKKPDNRDTQDKLRKANGALAQDTNRDRTEPSASAPPSAIPALVASSLAAAAERKTHDEIKSQAEAEELAKRVVRSIASVELRARRQAKRELQEPLSEAASAPKNKLSRDKVKRTTEEADKQAEKTTENREPPKVPSQPAPAPTAETAEEAPSVQGSKQPDTVAGKTYRVLVVFSVKSTE